MWYLISIGVLALGLILVKVWPGRKSAKRIQTEESDLIKVEEVTDDDYDTWLLEPGEDYVRIPIAGTYIVLACTIPFEELLSGNFQTGQWLNFIVGYHPIGSPSFEIGGVVKKSRMINPNDEPVRETMLTDEKNGRRLLLLLGVAINKQVATMMVTGVQT